MSYFILRGFSQLAVGFSVISTGFSAFQWGFRRLELPFSLLWRDVTQSCIRYKRFWAHEGIWCFVGGKMFYHVISLILNPIGGVMVSVLASSAVDPGFESRSGQTKDYKIGICCFSAKHESLRRKSKDWLARNQYNVSEWSDMSTCRLLFQWASTIKIQLSVLV